MFWFNLFRFYYIQKKFSISFLVEWNMIKPSQNLEKDLPSLSQIIWEEVFENFFLLFLLKVNDYDIVVKLLIFHLILITEIEFKNYVRIRWNLTLECEEKLVQFYNLKDNLKILNLTFFCKEFLQLSCSYNFLRKVDRSPRWIHDRSCMLFLWNLALVLCVQHLLSERRSLSDSKCWTHRSA